MCAVSLISCSGPFKGGVLDTEESRKVILPWTPTCSGHTVSRSSPGVELSNDVVPKYHWSKSHKVPSPSVMFHGYNTEQFMHFADLLAPQSSPHRADSPSWIPHFTDEEDFPVRSNVTEVEGMEFSHNLNFNFIVAVRIFWKKWSMSELNANTQHWRRKQFAMSLDKGFWGKMCVGGNISKAQHLLPKGALSAHLWAIARVASRTPTPWS